MTRFGPVVSDSPASSPTYAIELLGQYVKLIAVHPDHAEDLYELVKGPDNTSLYDYLFDEQPTSLYELRSTLASKAKATNPWTYTIIIDNTAVGTASLMRMDLPNRVIEVGSIMYTHALQRTPAATEAMYLLTLYVFETLGFRRYEWKCNSLNEPSRRAARRLGFVEEGTFRQHMIIRGHNRDTTWFAMLDSEWPLVKKGYEKWLDKANFDEDGRQKRTLELCRLTEERLAPIRQIFAPV